MFSFGVRFVFLPLKSRWIVSETELFIKTECSSCAVKSILNILRYYKTNSGQLRRGKSAAARFFGGGLCV